MESFNEIIQQNPQWIWIIVIIIGVISSIFNYRRIKRVRREAQEQQKEYYDCFDDEGNYIEGKMEEYMKKQKERYNKKYNNYSDDMPDKPYRGYFQEYYKGSNKLNINC